MSRDGNEVVGPGWPWTFQWPSGGQALFGFAPQQLSQPINPGWTFGNVIVNGANSSAPEVEQSVVSRHSYGRQIGRLIDAVSALADALPKTAADERVQALRHLAEDVDRIKREAACARIGRLQAELRALKEADPDAFRALAAVWGP